MEELVRCDGRNLAWSGQQFASYFVYLPNSRLSQAKQALIWFSLSRMPSFVRRRVFLGQLDMSPAHTCMCAIILAGAEESLQSVPMVSRRFPTAGCLHSN